MLKVSVIVIGALCVIFSGAAYLMTAWGARMSDNYMTNRAGASDVVVPCAILGLGGIAAIVAGIFI